jgi:hypothetical protein
MMDLSREICEREIKACQAAITAHEEGLLINTLVKGYFEKELKKFPEKKKPSAVG